MFLWDFTQNLSHVFLQKQLSKKYLPWVSFPLLFLGGFCPIFLLILHNFSLKFSTPCQIAKNFLFPGFFRPNPDFLAIFAHFLSFYPFYGNFMFFHFLQQNTKETTDKTPCSAVVFQQIIEGADPLKSYRPHHHKQIRASKRIIKLFAKQTTPTSV